VTRERTRVGDEKYCGACGEIINKAAVTCPKCGVPQTDSTSTPTVVSPPAQPTVVFPGSSSQPVILGAGEKYCSSCGSVVKIMAEVCPSCGVRQSSNGGIDSTYDVPVKNKWIAVILALWLGGLGAHKFYLGKYAQGVIYLVLCWTFVPFVIGWVEAVVYAFTPEEGFSERYSQRR
jgi:TM2 domain-containing membrane protein YozV/RNA polymerase subunit RPABC4/transcription elongation factor Spt4